MSGIDEIWEELKDLKKKLNTLEERLEEELEVVRAVIDDMDEELRALVNDVAELKRSIKPEGEAKNERN